PSISSSTWPCASGTNARWWNRRRASNSPAASPRSEPRCANPPRRRPALARALDLEPALLSETQPENLRALCDWIDAFPPEEHGAVWLDAFEAGYRERLLEKLGLKPAGSTFAASSRAHEQDGAGRVRPQAQAVFCIDVRSEPLRRNLEATGDYETFG